MTSRLSPPQPAKRAQPLTAATAAARFAIVGALAAFGAVAWAGCGPGSEARYYCDEFGCHSCDAYGCSEVKPPTAVSCTGNASCKAGETCTTAGCAAICASDASCSQGTVCRSGLCVAPGTTPAPKECTTKSDCGAGKTCTAGSCQACGGTAGPCPCTSASECDGGQACVAGACTAPQNTCKFSSECGDGKVCANGQCLASCESTPCGTNFTCEKGVCQPVAPGTCATDAQCSGATPNCVLGSCVKSCAADPECGAGNFCNQGVCAVDTRPKPNCTDDNQCGGGTTTPKKCIGGFCKYTCTSDQYCRTIDTRIGYCAKDLVCRNATEANAACVGPSDCADGKQCIDNQCK